MLLMTGLSFIAYSVTAPWGRRETARTPDVKQEHQSITVLIPAFNEARNIRGTLDSILRQTVRPEKIIVVDDCSTDGTNEIAREYPVEVVRTPRNAGSKAEALNYVLPRCSTDLATVIDADITLAPDYLEQMLPAFADPKVTLACGCILSKNVRTPAERGRSIEWLFSNHFYRPIQSRVGAPVVIPGCATVYRMENLRRRGGWTSDTVCEDIDYTWVALMDGEKAIYVADAVARTIDPHTGPMLGRQVNRWMSSYFQSFRLHWNEVHRKPLLALWVILILLESILIPLYWASPVLVPLIFHIAWLVVFWWWLGTQILVTCLPLAYAVIKRRLNPLPILANIPFSFYTRVFSSWYTARAMFVELVLVPLQLSKGMTVFRKGNV